MKYLIAILTLLSLSSCKKEFSTPEIKAAYESVMEVHDEVMPEISTIQKLKRKIKKLDTKDKNAMDLIVQLEKADDGMMDWMKDFKLDGNASIQDQLMYLSSQQANIDKVSSNMKNSIKQAQNYLNVKHD